MFWFICCSSGEGRDAGCCMSGCVGCEETHRGPAAVPPVQRHGGLDGGGGAARRHGSRGYPSPFTNYFSADCQIGVSGTGSTTRDALLNCRDHGGGCRGSNGVDAERATRIGMLWRRCDRRCQAACCDGPKQTSLVAFCVCTFILSVVA